MKKDIKDAIKFITPLSIFLILFILLPVVGTIINSLYKDVTFIEKKFVLFENYKTLFKDKGFFQSLKFTILFIVASVPAEIVLGILIALVLNEVTPLSGFLRVAVLIPWAIPSVISARIWQLIYNYNFGLLNFILLKSGLTCTPINFLGTKLSSFVSIVIADIWKTTPFVSLIILAGLQTIPESIYDQAKVDGAGIFKRFFYITLPLLKGAITVALLFRTIDAVRIFDLIYILTGGGPGGSTTSLSLYGYKFFLAGDFGYGSTVSCILFVISLIFSIFYVKSIGFKKEFL